jgi:hypothetical protein
MRKLRILAVAALAGVLTAAIATPARADDPVDVLTSGSAAGTNVAVGDVITAALKSGTTTTFHTSATGTSGITCTASTFTATVTANPPTPDTATESLTAQTFGGCTASIVGVTGVNSITVDNLPYVTSVVSATDLVTVSGTDAAPIQTTIQLRTVLGSITCVYRATGNAITGQADNTDNSITFTNQVFAKFSGPGTCAANGYFTSQYSPIQDSTQTGAPSVFVN